jgi:hypothetical protein
LRDDIILPPLQRLIAADRLLQHLKLLRLGKTKNPPSGRWAGREAGGQSRGMRVSSFQPPCNNNSSRAQMRTKEQQRQTIRSLRRPYSSLRLNVQWPA